jgi:hypothetical protein
VLAASAVAVLHAATVLFVLTGSLLALRWPRLLWLHVPVGLAVLGLYLTGSDCPLTTWELVLREEAGQPGYPGGFIGHYLTEPLGFPIEATSTQIGVVAVAFLPNLVGYGLLVMRSGSRGRRATRPAGPVPAWRRSPRRPPGPSTPAPGHGPGVPARRP